MAVRPVADKAGWLLVRRGSPLTVSRVRKVVIPIGLGVLWWVVTRTGMIDPLFLPSPVDLWEALKGMRTPLPGALRTTVTMTLTGFALGSGIGVVTGLAMAYSRLVRELFGLVFDFLRPVPVFALIPLFILWFGIGRTPQVALITVGTSVILGVTTIEAIRNVPPIYVRASLTLGADRFRIYRTVVVPSIVPHLVGAIRVAAAASWGLDVAAEFMGSQEGLGFLMINRQSYLDTAGILLIVLIYSLLALFFDTLIRLLEGRITRWTERRPRAGAVGALLGSG